MDDLPIGDLCTVVSTLVTPTIPPSRPVAPEGQDAVAPGATVLARYCAAQQLLPRVQPILHVDDPPIDGPGDARYALGALLGSGGVGQVSLAVDRDLRRSVALKTLGKSASHDAVQLQAFLEEAIITGGLEHPNIVPIYELSHSPALGPFYTMKRLAGRPLSDVLRDLHRGDPDATARFGLFKLLAVFLEVARAIAFAHARDVVHCDLKPSNVVVGDFGEVVVVDWGLARVCGGRGEGQARALLRAGTPAYMPPEQAVGTVADLDPQSDIWSLGVMLYELLTLSVPFTSGANESTLSELLHAPIEPPSKRAPERGIPMDLERITMHALRRDKARRYASVGAMIEDLEAFLAGTRERERREEAARTALAEIATALRTAAPTEREVDHRQAVALGASSPPEGPDPVLEQERETLLGLYADAAASLKMGLAAVPDDGALKDRLGDLYWRFFARLYPGRIAAPPGQRDRSRAILASLCGLGLAAIVAAARRGAPATSSELPSGDPWLEAVTAFVRGDGIEVAGAPGALATIVEKIRFLKAVSLFRGLASTDLLPIAEVCTPLEVPAGNTIFSQGAPAEALFVVMRGEVDILRDGSPIAKARPFECFGEIAVLDDAPRTAAAIAATDVSCLVLTAHRFRGIVAENGQIGLGVILVLTERLREATLREATLRGTTAPPTAKA